MVRSKKILVITGGDAREEYYNLHWWNFLKRAYTKGVIYAIDFALNMRDLYEKKTKDKK